MQDQKSQTFKAKREQHEVTQQLKDELKKFNATKKKVIGAFGEEELNIPELAEKTGLSREEALYYAMTFLKFGWLKTTRLDDMDEYYYYKISK